MAYASWSVVFGEQPSAAKWNILGTNDASFNDGTGIAGLYKNLLTADSNPYKFSAYRNAAATTGAGSFAKITFDTELYDTNNNFATGTYTAPVTGFYQFSVGVQLSPGGVSRECAAEIYKNGAAVNRIGDGTSTADMGFAGGVLLSLTAADTIDVYAYGSAAVNLVVGVAKYTYITGFLVSKT